MTVKELKEYLNQFNDNLTVFVVDWSEDFANPVEVEDGFIFVDIEYQERYERIHGNSK